MQSYPKVDALINAKYVVPPGPIKYNPRQIF